ncbi:MAG: arylsulfatase [Phycisphaerae bacterium]|nr:arylsulfatase [Phycisphaerae bacterium]
MSSSLPLVAVLALGGAAASPSPVEKDRPNFVLIMADDMGYSDIGCFGGEIRTPNLDRLAADGVRFTNFYNTARCCPTRAALLTGRYPHQVGVGHMVYDGGSEGYRGELASDSASMAEALGAAGYATGMSGKWHVTHNLGRPREMVEPEQRTNWPLDRGFESFYGTIHGAGSFFDPVTLARGDDYIERDREDFHYTDRINEEAADYIRRHAADGDDRPFLLYVAHTAPHWPLHAREKDIARWKGRYDAGWDELRAERHRRMKAMGLVDPAWPLTARDQRVRDWDQVEHPAWQARRMEVYAAQVEQLDRGIGWIVDALRETGQLDDTVIVFIADNGGCAEEITSGWGSLSIPEKTHDGRTVVRGNDPAIMPGDDENYQSYGIPWANASNTPFRLYKHHVHEGGIASPCVVHWPAGIEARGELRDTPGHVIDLLPTFLDLAGAEAPAEIEGRAMEPMEGVSLAPALDGGEVDRDAIYWEHEGNRAVRQGRWKLVARHKGAWELYDLEADRTEMNDLADTEQERVERMIAMYDAWAERAKVRPWPLRKSD